LPLWLHPHSVALTDRPHRFRERQVSWKDIPYDPTLHRADINCPTCNHHQAVLYEVRIFVPRIQILMIPFSMLRLHRFNTRIPSHYISFAPAALTIGPHETLRLTKPLLMLKLKRTLKLKPNRHNSMPSRSRLRLQPSLTTRTKSTTSSKSLPLEMLRTSPRPMFQFLAKDAKKNQILTEVSDSVFSELDPPQPSSRNSLFLLTCT
jgi:hypothetical protein